MALQEAAPLRKKRSKLGIILLLAKYFRYDFLTPLKQSEVANF